MPTRHQIQHFFTNSNGDTFFEDPEFVNASRMHFDDPNQLGNGAPGSGNEFAPVGRATGGNTAQNSSAPLNVTQVHRQRKRVPGSKQYYIPQPGSLDFSNVAQLNARVRNKNTTGIKNTETSYIHKDEIAYDFDGEKNKNAIQNESIKEVPTDF